MTVLLDEIYKVKDIVKNARYDARIRICTKSASGEYSAVYDGEVYGLYDYMKNRIAEEMTIMLSIRKSKHYIFPMMEFLYQFNGGKTQ